MKTRKILSIIITILMSVSILSACNLVNQPTGNKAEKLVKYTSYKSLQSAIEKRMKNSGNFGFRNKGEMMETAMDNAAGDGAQKSSLQDYSKTNLQVEGVDEADIVKTDGEYLYIISNGRFIIVDAKDPANMKIVSQIQYLYINEPAKNTKTPIEMLLDEKNNHMILLSYSYDDRYTKAMLTKAAAESSETKPGTADGASKDMAIAPDYYFYGQQNVLAQVIDLNEIAKPTVIREFLQEGYYLSSRRIDEYVYIVTNKYIYTYGDDFNKEFYIPAIKDSAASNDWEMLPVEDISVVPNQGDNSFLLISSLNTNDQQSSVNTKAILGAGQNIYASTTNIYIASARYTYDQTSVKTGDAAQTTTKEGFATTQIEEAVNEPANDGEGNATEGNSGAEDSDTVTEDKADSITATNGKQTAPDEKMDKTAVTTTGETIVEPVKDVFQVYDPPVYKSFTDIYRFAINKGDVTEKGSGVVPGYILNQFSMDEHNGYFRIATTTGDSWRQDQYTSMNNVYILDSDLKITGKLEGLASRETIKSARFLGNKAYLVTFRTVDPLFVLDLSNPQNPVVKGELKVPGYSEYLHPIGEDLVVGFGKDAVEVDNMAYYLGMKISVFDVSDVSNPREISTMKFGDRGTNSEVTYNHKALLYSKEKNIIGFPITIYEVPESQKNIRFAYGMPVFTGYIILGLTSDNKLYEKGRVSHYTLEIPKGYPSDPELKNEDWAVYDKLYQSEYLYHVYRGMFIGDTLYTVSNAFVKATSLADFKTISTLDVPGFKEMYQSIYPYAVK